MEQTFKIKGNSDKTGYDVLANLGPRTRFFSIGHVLKRGRKWTYNDIDFPSKKIAVAACTGDYLLACASAAQRDADRERANEEAPCDGLTGFSVAAPLSEGTLIRHKLGYVGPAVYCSPSDDGKRWRVGLRTQQGKALVIGTWGVEISLAS